MTSDLWKLKIQAFLHDPPEKAVMLLRGESHVARASELLPKLIGDGGIPENVKMADHVAAASSRAVVEGTVEEEREKPQVQFHKKPVLIHPLSGREFNLSEYGGPLVRYDIEGDETILKTSREAVDEALEELKSPCGNDLGKLFFALWRLLPERLAGSKVGDEKSRLGALWYLLPADTRTPDHSIWDHLCMTSAVAAALPRPAFLLFAIGPVQSFITTARRTQDLWMGSYLLSYLTWCAARAVVEEMGPDAIIFPNLWRQPLVDRWLSQKFGFADVAPQEEQLAIANFPNRFMAIVPEDKAAELAGRARKALYEEWERVRSAAKKHMETEAEIAPDEKWNELWEKQTKSFFETYWVAFPWCIDGANPSSKDGADAIVGKYTELLGENALKPAKDQDFGRIIERFHQLKPNYVNLGTVYELLYDLSERALGARKGLRDFSQSAEEGYKCALCGEREALYSHLDAQTGRKKEEKIRSFWDGVSRSFPGDFKRGGGERLCAVCATKRLAFEAYFKDTLKLREPRFPSTSSIAVASFQVALLGRIKEDDSLREAFTDYVQKVAKLKKVLGMNWDANSVYQAWGMIASNDFPAELQETAREFLRTDGDYLFEDTFEPEGLRREYRPDLKPGDPVFKETEEEARQARNALKRLLEQAKELGITKPSRYMAVLAADGDSMGQWLSGQKAPDTLHTVHPHLHADVKRMLPDVYEMRRPLSPFLHNAISASLRDFSTRLVRYVIENRHAGKLVYAGGDDLLALLPKDKVIPATREIRMLYSGMPLEESSQRLKSRNGFVKRDDELLRMMGETATLSAGIAIVHHSHSLADAVSKAHEILETNAKKRKGKNALAVASVRRSGELRMAESPWFVDGGPADLPVDVLIEFRGYFAEQVISPRFVHALKYEIASGLKGVDQNVFERRLWYLLDRHIDTRKMPGSTREERKREAKELASQLTDKLMKSLGQLRSTLKGRDGREQPQPELDELLDLLELAVFLAREERA